MYNCIVYVIEELADAVSTTAVKRMSSELFRSCYTLLKTYWVLVVVAAFLLVFLTGEPNLFKTIYLIFFFVFLITYQVRINIIYICIIYMYSLRVSQHCCFDFRYIINAQPENTCHVCFEFQPCVWKLQHFFSVANTY